MDNQLIRDCLDFINKSPSCYHVAANLAALLEAAGHTLLREEEVWNLSPGMRYYVSRGGSVLAFRVPWGKGLLRPKGDFRGFRIAASHTDSPSFQLREEPEVQSPGGTVRLAAEPYGGGIWRSWLDRPLTVAGRAVVRDSRGRLVERLVYVDRDLLVIPSLAIHMNREVNKGKALLPQTDLLPLFSLAGDTETSTSSQAGPFRRLVADTLGVEPGDILSTDLFLVPRVQASLTGLDGEFLAGPRLDALLCVFSCLQGYLTAQEGESMPLLAMFDHEEVGSGTWEGAGSAFLRDVLERICEAQGQELSHALSQSFLLSTDNAHAVHPAHPEYADRLDAPVLGGGVVLKYSAARRYTTDAVSAAVFREVCNLAGVPLQRYSNRADLPGGSTLGHLAAVLVSVRSVDVGLPQLAMHSAYEMAAAGDVAHMVRAVEAYYSREIRITAGGIMVE